MEQKANITIDKEHITVERTQTACGREIRVISVFPRHGSETVEDKLPFGVLWCRNALNGLTKKRRTV